MTTTLIQDFNKVREDFATWYDSKSEDTQSLIDEISDRTSYIIDEDEYDEFIEELNSYGITTSDEFEDRFYMEMEGTGDRVTTEFCEEMLDQTGDLDNVPDYIVGAIDYSRLWNSTLKYDYSVVEFKGNSYFFIG